MKLLNIDKRLEKNGQDFFNSMVDKKTVCLRRLGSNRAETVRYERWIRNKKVTIPKIIEAELQKGAEKANQVANDVLKKVKSNLGLM